MVRALAFSVALTLLAAPFAQIVCGLACETSRHQHHVAHLTCHESTGPAVTGIHTCEHELTVTPGVLAPTRITWAPIQTAPAVLPPAALASEHAPRMSIRKWLMPPGAVLGRSPYSTILRI